MTALFQLAFSWLLTKLFYFRARIIRFPACIRVYGRFKYGTGLTIGRFPRIDVFQGAVLRIGNRVEFNDFVHLACAHSMFIGDDCLIASSVFITDHDHQVPIVGSAFLGGQLTCDSVSIGNRVWLGQRVTVLKGVTICDDCVVGAGSIVSRSLILPGVYVGTPAKLIKSRLD